MTYNCRARKLRGLDPRESKPQVRPGNMVPVLGYCTIVPRNKDIEFGMPPQYLLPHDEQNISFSSFLHPHLTQKLLLTFELFFFLTIFSVFLDVPTFSSIGRFSSSSNNTLRASSRLRRIFGLADFISARNFVISDSRYFTCLL